MTKIMMLIGVFANVLAISFSASAKNHAEMNESDSTTVESIEVSAKEGDDIAQNNLGVMYANGRGVAQDAAQAVSWYRKSAEQGNADAQDNFGRMCER